MTQTTLAVEGPAMTVLSNCLEGFAGLARAEEVSEVAVDSLLPSDRVLWRGLGGGSRLWRGTAPNPGPRGFWSRAVVVDEVPFSQFDRLRRLLGDGAELPGPVACVALRGHGFHGQRNRPWLSAPGNLHLCAVVPTPGLPARETRSLPMLPAVAVLDAIRAASGGTLRPGIKWVNDVLLDGRKIAGVLAASEIQGDRVVAVLLGIGLNVATAPPVPPTPFVPSVTSLADAGVHTTWAEVAVCLLAALGRRTTDLAVEGASGLLEAYRAASLVIGREVCVFPDPEPAMPPVEALPTPLARGTVRAVATDLSLVLEGVEAPVDGGRLAFAEDCAGGEP